MKYLKDFLRGFARFLFFFTLGMIGMEFPGPTLLAISYWCLYRGIVYYATKPLQA